MIQMDIWIGFSFWNIPSESKPDSQTWLNTSPPPDFTFAISDPMSEPHAYPDLFLLLKHPILKFG